MTYATALIVTWTLMSLAAVGIFLLLLCNAYALRDTEAARANAAVKALANARVRDLTLQFLAKMASLIAGLLVAGDVLLHWWTAPPGGAALALIVSLICNTLIGVLDTRDDQRWRIAQL